MSDINEGENKVLRIGTRRSLLAKAQTNWVVGELSRMNPELKIEIVEIVTTGDRILDRTLSEVPGKGVFVKEIEERMLAGDIDLAVHSMKDLPAAFPAGLGLGAVSRRVDARDVLVTRHDTPLSDLPSGAKIGTSSLRRQVQLLKCRPDLTVIDIRGNIDTRLRKSESEEYDGILLAAAGLIRMGWDDRIQEFISLDDMIPAVGQGALGIEIREGDEDTATLLAPLNDPVTDNCVEAERVFLEAMGGGCHTPMGAYCRQIGEKVELLAFGADDSGDETRRLKLSGRIEDASRLALQAAAEIAPVVGSNAEDV